MPEIANETCCLLIDIDAVFKTCFFSEEQLVKIKQAIINSDINFRVFMFLTI